MAGTGKKPNVVQNFLGRFGDRLIPGNNWNPQTGTWTATPTQYIGGIGGIVGNAVAPGLGTLIRNGTHGATTGQGIFGFLQRGGNFQGNPVNQMTFNPQFGINGAGPGGTSLVSLDPATGIPFTLPGLNPTQRFNPGAGNADQRGNSFLGGRGPNFVGGMGSLTGVASQMGGARGAYGSGGITGDAARAMFAGLTRGGPQYFSTIQNYERQE
jgi:hypothetical protein